MADTTMTKIGFGLVFQIFCTDLTEPDAIAYEANRYYHPGTSQGWVVSDVETLKTFYEANEKIMDGVSFEELVAGVPCQTKEGFKHVVLNC